MLFVSEVPERPKGNVATASKGAWLAKQGLPHPSEYSRQLKAVMTRGQSAVVSLQCISHEQKLATLSFQTAFLQHGGSVHLGKLRKRARQAHGFDIDSGVVILVVTTGTRSLMYIGNITSAMSPRLALRKWFYGIKHRQQFSGHPTYRLPTEGLTSIPAARSHRCARVSGRRDVACRPVFHIRCNWEHKQHHGLEAGEFVRWTTGETNLLK